MIGKLLTTSEKEFVEELRGNTRDKFSYMKLSVLILLDMGKDYDEVVAILGIGRGTISNCLQKYRADKYLDKHYVPYSGKMSDEQLGRVDSEVSAGFFTSSQQVRDFIEKEFGILYSLSAARGILEKLGFVYRKTSEVPCRFSEAEQEAFLEQFVPFLEETPEDEAVFSLDGVHPTHNTRSSYAWVKKGQEKVIPTNTGRERLNLSDAMNAHRPEEVIVHHSEWVNAQATVALLEKIETRHADKERICAFADNAGYYKNATVSDWLDKHPRVVLLFLPSYSPNLNLIERLWKFMRKKVINTTFYPTFKEFKKAILEFFEKLHLYKDELDSLISFKFQRLGKPVVA
ncbi:MAG: IS630 family transposase [Saprospiraceae bacterium]|nr:IS630 family transposase [Saprospiraceae bacterium]